MRNILLPNTEVSVSPICLGCGDWQTRPGDSEESIYAAYRSAGGNFFDTAHCYAFWVGKTGVSEKLLGSLIQRDKRSDVIIATKGGHRGYPKYPRPDDYLTPGLTGQDLAESLDRLRTDYVDLYYLHRDDERVGVDEIMDGLAELVKSGKVKALGASNWSTARIASANDYAAKKGLPMFAASQPRWSLARSTDVSDPSLHEPDEADLRWHAKTHLPMIPYSPNAKGFFAGRDVPAYDTPSNRLLREKAAALGKQLNATPDQVALAWLMHQPFPVVPIVGTLNLQHLKQTVDSTKLRLSSEQANDLQSVT